MSLTSTSVRFGPALLHDIITQVEERGYRFARFDQSTSAGEKWLRLRWDVDISPAGAFSVGKLLHQRGVQASFCFQLNAETYNLLTRPILDGLAELRDLGHAVGLHLDQNLLGEDEQVLSRTLDWFDQCCQKVDRLVSFHRPSATVLGKRYESFINTYAEEFFSSECYLSDSRRSLDFLPRLLDWLKEGRTPLQLLLHPEWWEPFEDARAVWKNLRQRRLQELENYVKSSFSKVFSPEIIGDLS